jgi:hypothetical protein
MSRKVAYAWVRCNAWKGPDIGAIDPVSASFVVFFHPRRHRWEDPFRLDSLIIEPFLGRRARHSETAPSQC